MALGKGRVPWGKGPRQPAGTHRRPHAQGSHFSTSYLRPQPSSQGNLWFLGLPGLQGRGRQPVQAWGHPGVVGGATRGSSSSPGQSSLLSSSPHPLAFLHHQGRTGSREGAGTLAGTPRAAPSPSLGLSIFTRTSSR